MKKKLFGLLLFSLVLSSLAYAKVRDTENQEAAQNVAGTSIVKLSPEEEKEAFKALERARKRIGKEDKEMAVTFVTNERSHELNLEYRDTDRPTDVISLEYKPEMEISFDEEDLAENPELAEMMAEFDTYIGELFISIDKAREQAEEYGHSFEREMGFLAVHGFLHINGYDHYTPEEEKEMFGLQEEILTAYGLTRQ